MILCENLNYTYNNGRHALVDVNAVILPGLHLLMGENGAGKTTLLHAIAGLLFPQTGRCTLDDVDVARREPSTMSRIFFLADNMLWPAATINELVATHACFFPSFDETLLRSNLKAMDLTGAEKLRTLSLGNRKKAAIAYALSLRTDVLLLDEPANGLDITGKKALQKILMQSMTDTQTVIVSTHTVWDLKNLFESVMMVRRGRLVLNAPIYSILDKLAFVFTPAPVPGALYAEEEIGGYRSIVPNDGTIESDINFTALYSALSSDAAISGVLRQLNS